MRPKPILWFERAYLAALAIDLLNNINSWPLLERTLAARGVAPSVPLVLVMVLASPAIGLALWYFVARRGSQIAKWIATALIAFAVVAAAFAFGRMNLSLAGLPLVLGFVAAALKLFAVVQLHTRAARPWFGETAKGPAE